LRALLVATSFTALIPPSMVAHKMELLSEPAQGFRPLLSAPKVDSVNTFVAPNTVTRKPFSAQVQGGKLVLNLEPKSLTVVSLE
jgi:alpha-L-arabinofuranosidase